MQILCFHDWNDKEIDCCNKTVHSVVRRRELKVCGDGDKREWQWRCNDIGRMEWISFHSALQNCHYFCLSFSLCIQVWFSFFSTFRFGLASLFFFSSSLLILFFFSFSIRRSANRFGHVWRRVLQAFVPEVSLSFNFLLFSFRFRKYRNVFVFEEIVWIELLEFWSKTFSFLVSQVKWLLLQFGII